MKKKLLLCIVIGLFAVIQTNAQLAAGQDKFLGNTHTQGQTPLNFDHYWDQITPGNAGKWASCEQNRDDFNYWLWMDRAYDHARLTGMVFKEHTLVWGHSSGEPAWMSSVPQDEQMDEVIEWFDALSERYPDLEMIDVVNEPLHAPPSYTEALGGAGETGWDWVVWSFEKAREYFPNAILILNEYNVLNYTSTCQDYLEVINILNDRGLIDAIGCQGHSLETIPLSTIQTNMELLAATGLDIYISEYEARGDDATQLALYQEQFPYFWEHPSVKGVTLWGYLDGDMWRSEAFLLAADGVTERPALQWLKEYFNFTDNVPGPYTISTDTTGVGTITLSPSGGSYDYNATVTATANPGAGYVFSNWSGDVGGSTNPASTTMISNRELTAHFVPEGYIPTYTLEVTVSGNGSVTQLPQGDVFAEGAVVTLTAVPDEDYMFTGWSGTVNSSSEVLELTMESNSVLTATFAKIPGTGCVGEETISMNFEQNGIGEYCYVTQGTLEHIGSWNMDFLEANGLDVTNGWVNSIPASDDGLIHIHYVASVPWAHFEISGTDGGEMYTVEISSTSGGTVSNSGGEFPAGSVVEVTATPYDGYEFVEWTGDVVSTNQTIQIEVDGDKAVRAVFQVSEETYYTLNVATTGEGSVIPETQSWLEGTIVTLTAAPGTGYVFSNWSGDASGISNSVDVLMDSDKSVVANFVEDDPEPVYYDLTVTVEGQGSVSPTSGTYEEGSVVTLTATPDDGYIFSEWSGDANGSSSSVSVIINSDISVVATFIEDIPGPVYFDLIVNVIGNGTVSTTGGTYEAGTDVTITATPDSDAQFIEWIGDVISTSSTITVSMVEDITVTATFTVTDDFCFGHPETPVSLPFSQNGTGVYCFSTTEDISYVNSWNMAFVEINGVDFTNTWSNNMPAKLDGYYYIYYEGNFAWSHFEAASAKSGGSMLTDIFEAFPNPFDEKTVLHIANPQIVSGLDIMDQTGRIVETYEAAEILPLMQVGGNLCTGVYYIRMTTNYGIKSQIITKE